MNFIFVGLILSLVLPAFLLALMEIRRQRQRNKRWEKISNQWGETVEALRDSTKGAIDAVWAWQRVDGSLKVDMQGRALLYKDKPRYKKGRHGCMHVLLPIRGDE